LRSPINTLNRFEYDHTVQNHNAYLTIEIGDGHAPLPPEARQIMQEFGDVNSCDPELKMCALHYTSQFIARHPGFLAMHFAPSDRMLSPEDLSASQDQDIPVSLLLHPVPTEIARDAKGRDSYDLRLRNPQYLPGTPIELEGIPRAVPLGTAVSLLGTLFRAHLAGKITLEDGGTLSPSKKWSLFVHRENDGANNKVILSFYKDRMASTTPLPAEDAASTAKTERATETHTLTDHAKAVLSRITTEKNTEEPRPTIQRAVKPAPRIEALTNIVSRPSGKPAPRPAAKTMPSASTGDQMATPHRDMPDLQPAHSTAASVAAAPVAPPKATRRPAHAQSQNERVGLVNWMVKRSRTMPAEAHVRTSCFILIAGVLALANPYASFTGGHEVDTPSVAAATDDADTVKNGADPYQVAVMKSATPAPQQ